MMPDPTIAQIGEVSTVNRIDALAVASGLGRGARNETT